MRNYKKLPICTIAIAAANVLIFLGLSFMGMTEDFAFMMEHGAMYVPYLMNGERYYTLITSMFLHFGIQSSDEQYGDAAGHRLQPGTRDWKNPFSAHLSWKRTDGKSRIGMV